MPERVVDRETDACHRCADMVTGEDVVFFEDWRCLQRGSELPIVRELSGMCLNVLRRCLERFL